MDFVRDGGGDGRDCVHACERPVGFPLAVLQFAAGTYVDFAPFAHDCLSVDANADFEWQEPEEAEAVAGRCGHGDERGGGAPRWYI